MMNPQLCLYQVCGAFCLVFTSQVPCLE
uniref:Uncharacterized protein n=1 Tax=Arundo donax TaxID=35708 RepID=A0A0A9ALF3_ARUDO